MYSSNIAQQVIDIPPTTKWSGRNPGSTACIFSKLRRNPPAAVSRINATAISETTRVDLDRKDFRFRLQCEDFLLESR